ncbi:MAG TPA: NADH-quinone oxidoreductase subunit NuoK [Candidatus Limnocylindria bacterium]|nr:NADH-quinone oxidoreductase subunit NuoK [Candidatus Limnocylindria bacterium]
MTTAAVLYLGAVLFAVGAFGTLVRRSAAGRLVGVELMFGAATLTFVAAAAGFRELDGQVAAVVVIAIAAAQAGIGYALSARLDRSA